MFILNETNTIANQFIAELRNVSIQNDSMRFRRNMERIGELLAYEISKTLPYKPEKVTTPLGIDETQLLAQQPVLATILRAGLPLYQGFLNYFDRADSAFIAAYRTAHGDDNSFEINMEYLASPDLNGKILILADPMLATGKSLIKGYEALLKYGTPAYTHVAVAIASAPGVEFVQKHMPDCSLWIGALDAELNKKSYIVPGLGDAGDLSFGIKC